MRRNRAQGDVKPSLATHFPSLSKGPDIDLNVCMFTEDIHLAIMPIGGRTYTQKEFAVEFQGDKADCEKAKKIIGELGEYHEHDAAEIVCDAVGNIARCLTWEGQAVFELIYNEEHIYINGLTAKNIFKVFNWYLQFIPLGDWDLWKRKISFATKEKIWNVKMPYELGGMSGYKKVLKKLRKYSHLVSNFYRLNLECGITAKDFDFLKYVRDNAIYVNNVTKDWGWNRRDLSQDQCTEYYVFHRMLSFKYAQALLREHIISEINRLLIRLEIKCKLIVTGLPASSDILEMKNEMQKGELSFTAVTNKVAM